MSTRPDRRSSRILMTGQAQMTGVGRRGPANQSHGRRIPLASEFMARRALSCRDRRVDDLGLDEALVATQAGFAPSVRNLRVGLSCRRLPDLFAFRGRGFPPGPGILAAGEQGGRAEHCEGERQREQIA
jgi:hypothetical protein